MERSLFFARCALFVALVSAFEIYGDTSDSRSVPMVIATFFIALFWRDWRFQAYDFFSDLSFERLKEHRPSIFVFGSEIESSAPENVENDVLLDAELLSYRKQSLALYWGLVGGVGYLLHWRYGGFPFSWTLILAFLISSPLVQATHYTQQLIPLALSFAAVLAALWRRELPPASLLVLYFLSAFAVVAFLQNIRLNFVSFAFGSSARLQKVFLRSVVAGFGFCILVYAAAKLFPERSSAPATPPPVALQARDQAVTKVARGLAQLEKKTGYKLAPQRSPRDGGPTEAPRDQSTNDMHARADRPAPPKVDPEMLKKLAKLANVQPPNGSGPEAKEPQGGGGKDAPGPEELSKKLSKKSPEELEAMHEELDHQIAKMDELMKQPPQTPESARQQLERDQREQGQREQTQPSSQEGQRDVTDQDLQKLAKQDPKELQKQLESLRELQKHVEQATQEKKAQVAHEKLDSKPGGPTSTARTDQLDRPRLEDKTPNGIPDGKSDEHNQAKDDQAKGEQPSQGDQPNAARTKPKATGEKSDESTSEKNDEDRAKEIAREIDEKIENLETDLPYVVFGAIGLIIGLFVAKWLRRQKQKEVILTLTEEEKKQLADELRNIRERKLSPQQEIIETYNVMMDVLERVQLGREEGVPARVHVEHLKKRLPKMGAPLFDATDRFDEALYGDQQPGQEKLTSFRKSTKTIFKQFDIAA